MYDSNIGLNVLARNAPYHALTRELRDLEGWAMSLSIVLLGWVAVSLLLSPVIGRFIAAQNEADSHLEPRQAPSRLPASVRMRQDASATVRRNVAIQLSRRDTSWPRIG